MCKQLRSTALYLPLSFMGLNLLINMRAIICNFGGAVLLNCELDGLDACALTRKNTSTYSVSLHIIYY